MESECIGSHMIAVSDQRETKAYIERASGENEYRLPTSTVARHRQEKETCRAFRTEKESGIQIGKERLVLCTKSRSGYTLHRC
jgi:hypothetical protein